MGVLSFKRFLTYFFRGLLFVVPLTLTIYIIAISIQWLDGLLSIGIPGSGLVVIILLITIFGYLASTVVVKPIIDHFERLIIKAPLVSLIYTSLKDLMSAFVGDKRKFTEAALVTMNREMKIQRLGFVTREDLTYLGLPGKVAVYLPHSYNVSGNVYVVPRENVEPFNAPAADVMKFVVSGGVAGLNEGELLIKSN